MAIDYLLIERIVVGGGNEIVRQLKCSEVPRLTGRRLFFDPCRKAPEVPSQEYVNKCRKNYLSETCRFKRQKTISMTHLRSTAP